MTFTEMIGLSDGLQALLVVLGMLCIPFASNPNIVFSKEQIFDTIWGDEYYGDTATVPVHIQKIRKKIEKDPSNPEFIETLWGTGYRFNL